jgi:riboflavin kinase
MNYELYLTLIVLVWLMLAKSFLVARLRPGKAVSHSKASGWPLQSSQRLRSGLPVLKMTSKGVLEQALFLQGQVTHGYGRGSKKLGVPTANLPHYDRQLQENDIARGVYYGWAKVYGQKGSEIPCVANIGKSPTFKGQENAVNIVEVHVIDHPKSEDFYGSFLRVALVGFLRPEHKFDSFDALVAQINQDVLDASSACANADAALVNKVREFVCSDFETVNISQGAAKMTTVAPVRDDKLGEDGYPSLGCLFGMV